MGTSADIHVSAVVARADVRHATRRTPLFSHHAIAMPEANRFELKGKRSAEEWWRGGMVERKVRATLGELTKFSEQGVCPKLWFIGIHSAYSSPHFSTGSQE